MSDLIRDVVEDILQRRPGSPAINPRNDVAAAMGRPNYQRKKAEERIAQLQGVGTSDRVGVNTARPTTVPITTLSAEMRRTCLTHECDRAPRVVSRGAESATRRGEVIGRIGGSSGIWWLDHPDERALTERVRQVWDGGPMAMVVIGKTGPHHVVLLDELLHALDGAVRVRIGAQGPDGSLLIGIGHPDESRLKGELKTLANRLGRAQYPHKEVYLLEYPCAFIQQVLEVGSTPAMGILLDVPELDGVLIGDWIYQNLADTAVNVTVRDDWLLLTGPVEAVHQALDTAKWYRDRLRG
ncbi:MAG: hypothetical protein C7B46_15260 [Sulfobacillus benefaciens]|uniref:Uncharacterized protein n=1 Tax=Sulfobacillus benefaciens TaxID=453960 RepID=A0A2T2XCL3_9FIRM|nr:MAG: hypothetical protein C7B46_15260 [Sulfobacillus benefaciens]